MSLIEELITELEAAETLEAGRVAGGSDLLDTAQGASTLTPDAIAALTAKIAHETEQLDLIRVAITSLKLLEAHGYPVRRVFDVGPAITDELALKQAQMLAFAGEFRPIVIGADSVAVSERPAAVPEPTAKKKKAG